MRVYTTIFFELISAHTESSNRTLVFIRHGESEWNVLEKSEKGRGIIGRLTILFNAVWSDRYSDAKLSRKGREQCSEVATHLDNQGSEGCKGKHR